jgi:hypothetical protein
MYVILIAIVIFGLSQGPAKRPESKGPSKANGAEIAKQTQSTDKGDHQAANARLVPSEVTIGTQYNMESIPHDDHAQMADKERDEQDLKIQGQLALFTGLLVLVGLLAHLFGRHVSSTSIRLNSMNLLKPPRLTPALPSCRPQPSLMWIALG